MKTTMKDIAQRANVSITTVSHVLNNKPGRVSDELREKIQKIAKEMKYVPNHVAKQLVTQKSNTVGIVVPDLENTFFSSMVSRLQDVMRVRGYFVLVVSSGDEIQNDLQGIELLVSRGIDLLVLAISNDALNHPTEYLSRLHDIPVPTIMVDRIIDDYNGPKVRFNDLDGMMKLTDYVVSQNHRRIAFVNGDKSMVRTASRIQGFRQAMDSHDLTITSGDIYQGDYSYESGYALFDAIYGKGEYTAIIAANDMMAYGLIKRAYERNLTIPADISICGYDNVKFSEMLNPTLTTVNQNMDVLIANVNRLTDYLLLDSSYTENIIIDTQLVVRNSVRNLED